MDLVVIISSNEDFIEYPMYFYILYFSWEGHDDAWLPVMLHVYMKCMKVCESASEACKINNATGDKTIW